MVVSIWTLRQGNRAMQAARAFFDGRGYLEVRTRSLRGTTATDAYIESFQTSCVGFPDPFYLQVSPEYAHKIFLASIHCEVPIYEVARVFRNEPSGRLHSPEFSLIEWYHPGVGYREMMDETEALVRSVSAELGVRQWHSTARFDDALPIDVDSEFERLSVSEAFERYAGFSPLGLSHDALYEAARASGCRVRSDWSDNDLLSCVLVECVEPHLGRERPTFLVDYPASMASLAEVRPVGMVHGRECFVAERFELYICGIELCNGYTELNRAEELRRRMQEDNAERVRLGFEAVPLDEALLCALPQLGRLGGNALGWERLLMLCLGAGHIDEVMIQV